MATVSSFQITETHPWLIITENKDDVETVFYRRKSDIKSVSVFRDPLNSVYKCNIVMNDSLVLPYLDTNDSQYFELELDTLLVSLVQGLGNVTVNL